MTVDQGDGTYQLILQTTMPCSLRLMVNIDKNLGNNSGELPGLMVQVVPEVERPDSGRGSDGSGSPPMSPPSTQKNAASFTKGSRSRQNTGELSKLTPAKQADDSAMRSGHKRSRDAIQPASAHSVPEIVAAPSPHSAAESSPPSAAAPAQRREVAPSGCRRG